MAIAKIRVSDLIVWNFPLYYYGVPGTLKNLMDRQLPARLPFVIERMGGCESGSNGSHSANRTVRHVLVSTCGSWSARGNYDGILALFSHFVGKENCVPVFCGQDETLQAGN